MLKHFVNRDREKLLLLLICLLLHSATRGQAYTDSLDWAIMHAPDKNALAESYESYADYYDTIDVVRSIRYRRRSLEIYRELKDTNDIHIKLNNIGFSFYAIHQLDSAMAYYLKAAELIPALREAYPNGSMVLQNIADIHVRNEEYETALPLLRDSYSILKKRTSVDSISQRRLIESQVKCLQKLGKVNSRMGNHDSVSTFYRRGIQLCKEYDLKHHLSILYFNASTDLVRQEKWEAAMVYMDSMEIASREIDNIAYRSGVLFRKGYFMEVHGGDLASAIGFYSKALDSLAEIKEEMKELPQTLELKRNICLQLSGVLAGSGRYREAYSYLKMRNELADRLANREQQKEIARLKAKFETDKKEQRIAFLEELTRNEQMVHQMELDKQVAIRYIVLGVSILFILLLAGFFYFRTVSTRRLLMAKYEVGMQNALIEGQLEERARLARDLHDGLGGLLASIKMDIQAGQIEESKSINNGLIDKIGMACDEIRNISHELLPKSLEKGSFYEVLASLVSLYASRVNINFEFYPREKIEQIEPQNRKSIQYILQELILNVIKHAHARQLEVNMMVAGDKIEILVEDDGKGMLPDVKSDGIGLQNVKARISSLSGTIEIDSSHGIGTSIFIQIPLNPK